MARIPHGQPNQAFPSSSCSEILVTFPPPPPPPPRPRPPPPPPPPPPRLFLSLPAATARSLSFQMFRHARRLASIRILMKQTEPRRLRETARETTSSEPNSCNISSPYPATREIRLLFAPDEPATCLRTYADSITCDEKISAARPTYFRWARLSDLPVPCYAKLKGGFSLSLKTGGVEISGERHSEKVCNRKRSLSSYQQRVRSQQRSGLFSSHASFCTQCGGRVLKTRSSIRGSQVVEINGG